MLTTRLSIFLERDGSPFQFVPAVTRKLDTHFNLGELGIPSHLKRKGKENTKNLCFLTVQGIEIELPLGSKNYASLSS